jgi:hypothetical protein
VTIARLYRTFRISRRAALPALGGVCLMVLEPRSGVAQETAQIRMQLDQQALNTLPGDERAELQVKEDTSPAAEALKKRSPPGKAVPIIFIIAGVLSIPSIWSAVQEMLRRHEYGGVVIDTRTTPANIHHNQALQADMVMVIRADGSVETRQSTLATEGFLKDLLLNHKGG